MRPRTEKAATIPNSGGELRARRGEITVNDVTTGTPLVFRTLPQRAIAGGLSAKWQERLAGSVSQLTEGEYLSFNLAQ